MLSYDPDISASKQVIGNIETVIASPHIKSMSPLIKLLAEYMIKSSTKMQEPKV